MKETNSAVGSAQGGSGASQAPAPLALITSAQVVEKQAVVRLSREVARGRALRLRRGVYVKTWDWLDAPPWVRFRMSAASMAISQPQAVLCRATALALWGVPMLWVPERVRVRTAHDASVGLALQSPITGTASPAVLETIVDEWAMDRRRGRLSPRHVFTGHPTSRHKLPRGLDGPMAPSAGGQRLGAQRATLSDVRAVSAESGLRAGSVAGEAVEALLDPVEVAIAEVVPTMGFAEAVVVLDAALGGRYPPGALTARPHGADVTATAALVREIHGARARDRWQRAYEFADGDAESAGESYSRALLKLMGFEVPRLQARFPGPAGDGFRSDFFWESIGLIGEFDGRAKYGLFPEDAAVDAAEKLWAEKRREDHLRSLGLRVVRWTWDELADPAAFHALLTRAGVPRSRPGSTTNHRRGLPSTIRAPDGGKQRHGGSLGVVHPS